MEKSQIFNREALNKLRSPEKLDTMFTITTPISWIGVGTMWCLLFSILLWSIFGAFTVKVDGMGLIMDSAGVVNVSHIAQGKVAEVFVQKGQSVKRGDLIAKLEQSDRSADTQMAQYGMGLAMNDRDAMERVYQYDAKKRQQTVAENIYSDYDGIVDDVLVEKGSILGSNSPVCTIRLTQDSDELMGIIYVPVESGKRIEPGMTVQLAPNGVDISESGSLMGVVRSISQYPVSGESARQKLGNAQLAQWIQQKQDSALMEVTFDLIKDENSESGYLWTSSVGVHKPVSAGSFCTGSIIVERRPPIEKVFYKLSQWLRSR